MCTGTLVLDVDDLNQVGYVYFRCMSVLGCFCNWYVWLYFCYANNRNGGILPLSEHNLFAVMMYILSCRFRDGTDGVHPLFGSDEACQGRERSHSHQALP